MASIDKRFHDFCICRGAVLFCMPSLRFTVEETGGKFDREGGSQSPAWSHRGPV